jgi:hypothetical protein
VDRRLAERLAAVCAGRHLLIRHLLDDPAVIALDPALAGDLDPEERWGLLADLLNWLCRHRRALSTRLNEGRGGTTLYTVARAGETVVALADRHAAHLLARHPLDYLAYGLSDHLQRTVSDPATQRLLGRAVSMARDDGPLAVRWFPDGLPGRQRLRDRPELTARLSDYVQAVELLALEVAGLLRDHPREVERWRVARRLACTTEKVSIHRARAGTFYMEAQLGMAGLRSAERTRGPDRARPPLWILFPEDLTQPLTVFLILNREDSPGEGGSLGHLGHTHLPLGELGMATVTDIPVSPHRCCPELRGRLLHTDRRLVAFHLHQGAAPAIPDLTCVADPEADPDTWIRLRPHSCLVPGAARSRAKDPWYGFLLWVAPPCRGCCWELTHDQEIGHVTPGARLWNPRTGAVVGGDPGAPALSPDLCRERDHLLAAAAPFALSPRLRRI